jgi:hypothetical protein
MNERILKLAKQSGMRSPDLFKLTVSHMSTDTLEKFAELIVKECVKLQYKNVVVGGVSDYNRGRRELTEDIQKHFGENL